VLFTTIHPQGYPQKLWIKSSYRFSAPACWGWLGWRGGKLFNIR